MGKRLNSTSNRLDKKTQKQAIKIARKTLAEYVCSNKTISVFSDNKLLCQYLGVFITLKKNGRLRGCIGKLESNTPLFQTICDMTIAASCDPRFPKITPEELPEIKIEISILSAREKVGSWKEIKVGIHGVVLQKNNRISAFLPQVATENNWDLEKFLSQLCAQKLGLSSNCYKDQNANIYIFETQFFKEK